MASLQERNGSFRVIFSIHNRQHSISLGKVSPSLAKAKAARVEELLR